MLMIFEILHFLMIVPATQNPIKISPDGGGNQVAWMYAFECFFLNIIFSLLLSKNDILKTAVKKTSVKFSENVKNGVNIFEAKRVSVITVTNYGPGLPCKLKSPIFFQITREIA